MTAFRRRLCRVKRAMGYRGLDSAMAFGQHNQPFVLSLSKDEASNLYFD